MANCYTIRAVEARTGLSQHTIRAWERRYGALTPDRTGTNRRVYSDRDIEKLTLLRTALASGHTISQIAGLSNEGLKGLLSQDGLPKQTPPARPADTASTILDQCMGTVESFEPNGLMATLERGSALLGLDALVTKVVSPLVEWLGTAWSRGGLRIGHEHMASAVIRTYLDKARSTLTPSAGAQSVVVATPVGQFHELGAQMIAVRLAVAGFKVVYLGVNLPSEEIVHAATTASAKAVCLSVVFPSDDPMLASEIERLARSLGPNLPLILGGRAAASYESAISAAGGHMVDSMDDMTRILERN